MNLDFAAALATLNAGAPGGNAAFRIANAARPPSAYLFNTLLPEINMFGYTVQSANMVVRATMAGLVGMDSPYPPGGVVELSSFLENSAKIANHVKLPEQTLRHLQEMVVRLALAGQPTNEVAANEALNFLEKVIIQPHLDTAEWLRSECLVFGKLNWIFQGRELVVDYGVPAANFQTARTGNDAYHGSASKFWTDMYWHSQRHKGRVRAYVAHPLTIQAALYNQVNGLVQTGGDLAAGTITVGRWARNTAGTDSPGIPSPDRRDTVTFILYDREVEILNPATPGSTTIMPLMPLGKILSIGDVANDGYRPGMGSNEENLDPRRLGYTHIAPTVEGGGRMGRWAKLFVPEHEDYELHGKGATNLLPVLERNDGVAVSTTEMPA